MAVCPIPDKRTHTSCLLSQAVQEGEEFEDTAEWFVEPLFKVIGVQWIHILEAK